MMGGTQDKMAEGEAVQETESPKEETPKAVSRVQFAYQPGGPYPSHCGYCHSADEQFKLEGLWSNEMTVQDFQDLVDRGCQRSGKFVYLPANKLTCCPQYVMRLDVKTFRISKQQKRVVRRMNEYLVTGLRPPPGPTGEDPVPASEDDAAAGVSPAATGKKEKKTVKPGLGADPTLPRREKAKDIRRRKKEMKKRTTIEKTPSDPAISMELDIMEGTDLSTILKLPENLKYKLTTKLICVNPTDKEFHESYAKSYEIFRKFQMIIHKEPEDKCEEEHFMQFCVESPLILEEGPPGMKIKYGSYHQQYWIGDDLVMVGVLDFIPRGILCNYLYYNPEYRFIAPGVYSALYEISLTQELYRQNPYFQYYYMGYYVHDCPKMNYKRQYHSSCLLCLETLQYVPLAICRAKLDQSKYCGFSDEPQSPAEEDTGQGTLDDILVVVSRNTDPLKYTELRARFGDRLEDMMSKYVQTVGNSLAHKMILHLTGLVQQ